jgi:hypothetical protein
LLKGLQGIQTHTQVRAGRKRLCIYNRKVYEIIITIYPLDSHRKHVIISTLHINKIEDPSPSRQVTRKQYSCPPRPLKRLMKKTHLEATVLSEKLWKLLCYCYS